MFVCLSALANVHLQQERIEGQGLVDKISWPLKLLLHKILAIRVCLKHTACHLVCNRLNRISDGKWKCLAPAPLTSLRSSSEILQWVFLYSETFVCHVHILGCCPHWGLPDTKSDILSVCGEDLWVENLLIYSLSSFSYSECSCSATLISLQYFILGCCFFWFVLFYLWTIYYKLLVKLLQEYPWELKVG